MTLYGGNDGLNTVIPYADPAYHTPAPIWPTARTRCSTSATGLGLNPAMTGMHQMWQQASCAQSCAASAIRNPNHSHFVSMDIWQTAAPGRSADSGWLGRWLDAQPDDQLRALKAVSVGGTLPPLLAGTRTAGSSLPLGQFRLPKPGVDTGFTGARRPVRRKTRAYAAYAARDVPDLFTSPTAFGGRRPARLRRGRRRPSAPDSARQLDIVAACIECLGAHPVYASASAASTPTRPRKPRSSALLGEVD